jgi:hypothetical protein
VAGCGECGDEPLVSCAMELVSYCLNEKYEYIKESVNTKFLGLQIDNHLNWKYHIDQIVPKLSGACYTVALCLM